MLNRLVGPSGATGPLGESASHQKNFHRATIALACMMVLAVGVYSASAQTTKRSSGVPQSSRHDTGRLKGVPQQGPCVDPRPGNPGIPCWDGGCGQCGFQG
jgi:hypothetical protein